MRSVSGKYQLEDASAAGFFGTYTISLILRETKVTGRFGRGGFIQGTLSGQELSALWHDRTRKGWLRVRFAGGVRCGELEYGLESSQEVLGRSAFTKRLRSSRMRRPSTPPPGTQTRVNGNFG